MVKYITKISKETKIMAAGAFTGVVVPIVLNKYVDATYGPIVPSWGVWGTWGTFVPIVTGALALALGMFTKGIKKIQTRRFLGMYGVVALTGGVLNGALAAGWFSGRQFRARAAQTMTRTPTRPAIGQYAGNGISTTGITSAIIYS